MNITTLIENDSLRGRDDLAAEFGLSLHIETGGGRILFDTGTASSSSRRQRRSCRAHF
jgi:metal-dependent hydrolase (beta-lactamase superfamily II)